MKKKIKYLCLCLLIVVMTVFSACSSKSNNTDTRGSNSSADSEIPANVAEQFQMQAEGLLKQLYELDDTQLTQSIDSVEQSGQTALAEGIKNFQSTKESIGNLVSIDDTKVSLSDGDYIAKVEYTGELRKSEMTFGLDSRSNQVTVLSITPKYTILENMGKAAMNTVLGMGTVFIILIFISFLISLFKYINIFEKRLKEKTKLKNDLEPVINNAEDGESKNLEDDMELVAVITAAIAEFGNTDASNFIVRSIKRVKR